MKFPKCIFLSFGSGLYQGSWLNNPPITFSNELCQVDLNVLCLVAVSRHVSSLQK